MDLVFQEYDDEIGKLESLRVEQNEKIAEQAGKIEELERLGDQKDAEIDRLKSVVKNYIKKCQYFFTFLKLFSIVFISRLDFGRGFKKKRKKSFSFEEKV